ncbi:MAG: dihydrolipoamide acetyltransferase family protein, partial [Acidimicrobiia bacterium]
DAPDAPGAPATSDAAAAATAAPDGEPAPNSPALAKPPVRHLARQLGVDLAALAPGSGPGGIITRADVTRAAEDRTNGAAVPPPVSPVRPQPGGDRATAREIPVQGIRARIAERMAASHAAIPDAGCAVEADCSQLLAIRDAARSEKPPRDGADAITPFALILRLVVTALVEHPILNSVLDTEAGVIRLHDSIHLGIGASTDRGLLVPVVRHAEQRSTIELAQEVRRLADGARTGTLAPAELVGSTFTVSNFGSFGLDDGYPVINHPEVAILGVGAIRPRAVVVDGVVAARPTARFTCSFDHRVCDGADVGRFLARLRALVESPGLLLLDA